MPFQTSKQRLLALESMEAAAREEILLMETVSKTSHQMLTETEKHLREKMEISLAVQKHRELAAEAELRMEERVRKLRLRRSRDDVRELMQSSSSSSFNRCFSIHQWVANMSESLRQKEEEYTSRDSLLSEQWQSEDIQQRLQKQIRDEQRIRFEEEDRLNRMQEEVILSVYEVAIVLYYEVVIFLICANRSTISCSVSNWSERQN
jgi:hypothetical protein